MPVDVDLAIGITLIEQQVEQTFLRAKTLINIRALTFQIGIARGTVAAATGGQYQRQSQTDQCDATHPQPFEQP